MLEPHWGGLGNDDTRGAWFDYKRDRKAPPWHFYRVFSASAI